jgi:hypothetical protein
MKQTQEDRMFARLFADALQPHVVREREQGQSLTTIAAKLGISGAGLQRQLGGVTPSVRTIALAYAVYGVSVPYSGVEVAKAVSRGQKGKRRNAMDSQLSLPFEITVPASSNGMLLRLVPRSKRRYHLQLTVKMSA